MTIDLRGLEFHALQDHFVAADNGSAKVAARTADKTIGTRGRLGIAGTATHNNCGFIDNELGIDGDRARRCHRPGVTEQPGLHTGERADSDGYSRNLACAAFCGNCLYLLEQGQTYREFMHRWCSGDLDEFDRERQRLPGQRMIRIDGNRVVIDIGDDEVHDLAIGALALQLHANRRCHVFG